jgi:DNA polymerase III subunit delta'
MSLPAWLHEPLVRGIGQRGHAILVHGPGDVGQFAFGQALAAAWLCENPASNGLACGHCVSCKLLASGTHADYRLLVPDALRVALGLDAGDDDAGSDDKPSKAKPSKDIRIDAVRAALDWAHSTSARGRAKVLLIHPADALNMVSANALLKTLEEPPGRLRLVLTTHDPDVLLPTVRSRCQRLPLPMPEHSAALAWLAEQGVEGNDVLWAAAGGRPGDALAMWLDGVTAQSWSALPQAVRQGGGAAWVGWPLPRLIDALQKLCLDLLAAEQGVAARYFGVAALQPLAGAKPSTAALVDWSQSLMRAARHAEHPWHGGLKAEALFAHAQALWQTPRNAGPTAARPTATLRRS